MDRVTGIPVSSAAACRSQRGSTFFLWRRGKIHIFIKSALEIESWFWGIKIILGLDPVQYISFLLEKVEITRACLKNAIPRGRI